MKKQSPRRMRKSLKKTTSLLGLGECFLVKSEKVLSRQATNSIFFKYFFSEKQEGLDHQADEKIEVTYQREKKAHPGRTKLPDNLEVVDTVLEPVGNLSEMTCIGQEITEELGYQPEKFFLHRIVRKKYAPKSGEGSFIIAPLPLRVIDKGIPSVELLTQLLVNKYIDQLPLYRIRQRLARIGIKIPDSSIDGWVKTCLNRLAILYEYVQEQTKLQDYLQLDETTLKVQDPKLKGKTHSLTTEKGFKVKTQPGRTVRTSVRTLQKFKPSRMNQSD